MDIKHPYSPKKMNSPVKIFEPTVKKSGQLDANQRRSDYQNNITVIVTKIENHYYQHEYVYEYIDVKEVHHYDHGKKEMGDYHQDNFHE